jgi:YedE family putative selenium metabolism protein
VSSRKEFFSSAGGPVLTGLVIGILAPVLVKLGNPGNMGLCVACFTRDITGALGLHRAAAVQYLRPEIVGIVLGAFVAALAYGQFKPRTGSAPLLRFLLGAFAMIGALVFLGCPWRGFLRLSGGDWNALFGLAGLAAGVWAGSLFLKQGFTLGRSQAAPAGLGWVMPALMIGLLLLLVAAPQLGRDAEGQPVGPVFFSAQGPGSQHAPWLIALGAGLVVGFLAQRSRYCTIGGIRDLILFQNPHLFHGVLALVAAAFVTNLALGQFHPGFADQPVAHTSALWNFGGMTLAGLAFTLAGGCPGRQLAMSGEGDGDAALFVLGMLAGAAFAHNFTLASSPKGPGLFGPAAVMVGLMVCAVLGFTLRETVTWQSLPEQPAKRL